MQRCKIFPRKDLCFLVALFMPVIAWSGSSQPLENIKTWTTVATISAGPAWYHSATTQTIELQPGFSNTYVGEGRHHAFATGEIFLGLQGQLSQTIFGQFGIAVATTHAISVQGDIWELGSPLFNNFSYQYSLRHTYAAIKGKLLTQAFNRTWLPYLSASLGAGFNNTYGFSLSPKLFAAVPPPGFQSHTQTAFSYTVGAGIEKVLNQHWQAGVGYELADWGKSRLARVVGQTLNTGPQFNHLYTHQLQLSLSYFV